MRTGATLTIDRAARHLAALLVVSHALFGVDSRRSTVATRPLWLAYALGDGVPRHDAVLHAVRVCDRLPLHIAALGQRAWPLVLEFFRCCGSVGSIRRCLLFFFIHLQSPRMGVGAAASLQPADLGLRRCSMACLPEDSTYHVSWEPEHGDRLLTLFVLSDDG